MSSGSTVRSSTVTALAPVLDFAADLNASLHLSELVRRCTERAAQLLQAKAGFMALARGGQLRPMAVYGVDANLSHALEKEVAESFAPALFANVRVEFIAAKKYIDGRVLAQLGWKHLLLIRLDGPDDELAAVLCLADCVSEDDETVMLAEQLGRQAAAALENARLFARITHSSRQWAEIFDSIADLLLVHDDDYNVLRVNRAVAQARGKHPSDLVGLRVSKVFSSAEHTGECPFCLAGGFAYEFLDPQTKRVYLVSSSLMTASQEDGQHTVHILKDVTESRQVERLYRELFDNIQEGAFFSTPDGRFIEVNDALVRMLGYESREELFRQDIARDIYAAPGARDRLKESLGTSGKVLNQEVTLRKKDGSLIYVLENAFAVRDLSGEVVQYRGVLLDITEIKRVQSQLEREHEFNTQILSNTQSLIVVVDTAGLISYANPRCEDVAGFPEGELVGMRLEQIVSPSNRRALQNSFELALAGKPINNLELGLLRRGESAGRYSVNLSPMRNEAGDVNSVVAVMADITDAAMLQAKLMHTEKMAAIGQLVSGVAHEVNNPLTAILGFADLMLTNPEIPSTAKPELDVIIQEAQRTKEIVQNLLSFARQTRPHHRSVDVAEILKRTLALRSYDFANSGLVVEENYSAGLPQVVGDAQQLQQVFLNIINNAYDALETVERAGTLHVQALKTEGTIEVRICDNGPGISHIDRIFDPFFTTKEVGKGTGLGLSICYGIIREHGGEITCMNNSDSPGATFVVRLPVAQAASAAGGA